ncbi:hypothetical protein HME9302_00024 [Alteripontixanthobacter maritimus]|uniref:Uncharacterized protein n=1 Tax=Alteripontixanthobacter maritimus TaxID=2161824 RepID=A0A369Q4I3_9SPHN|nr:hypothetical protein [Alteripontixanthobacter maritimus]RDC59803.1 hypothetical protein HME9302_00998 [Alteripontixanthobacter maritimus]RDC66573.1 hypothetical protein HME9302_00024 [Alteripontixanthobacter maritimus]
MTAKEWPRLALTVFIMGLFGYAAFKHYSPAIEQTIVAISMLAVGYWLGSSKGSSDKTEIIGARPNGTPADPVFVEPE